MAPPAGTLYPEIPRAPGAWSAFEMPVWWVEEDDGQERKMASRRSSDRDQHQSISSQRQERDEDLPLSETTEILSDNGWRKVTPADEQYYRRKSNSSAKRPSFNEAAKVIDHRIRRSADVNMTCDQSTPKDYRNESMHGRERNRAYSEGRPQHQSISSQRQERDDDLPFSETTEILSDNGWRKLTPAEEEYCRRQKNNSKRPSFSEAAKTEMTDHRSAEKSDHGDDPSRASMKADPNDNSKRASTRQEPSPPRSDFSSITESFDETGWHPITESEKQGLRSCIQQAKEEKAAATATLERKKLSERYSQQMLTTVHEHPAVDSVPEHTEVGRKSLGKAKTNPTDALDDNLSEASTEVMTKSGWKKLSDVNSLHPPFDEHRPSEQPTMSSQNSGRSFKDYEKKESANSRNVDVKLSVKSNRGGEYRPSEQPTMSPKNDSRRSFNDYEKRESASSRNEVARRPSDKSNRDGDYCPSDMSTEIFVDNQWRKIDANDRRTVMRGTQERRQTSEVAAAKSEAGESEVDDCNVAPRRRSSTLAAPREHSDSARVSMRQSITPQDDLHCSSHQQDDDDNRSVTSDEHDARWIAVKLDLKVQEHLAVADGIVWDFNEAGAFIKRFKPEVECNKLVTNVRPKDKLMKINSTTLKRKSKAEIMEIWCDAQEKCNGHLTLHFLP